MKSIQSFLFIVFTILIYSTVYILFFRKKEDKEYLEKKRIQSIIKLSNLENSLDTNNSRDIISLNIDPKNSYNKHIRETFKYINENRYFLISYLIKHHLSKEIFKFNLYETHFNTKKEKKSSGLKNLIITIYGEIETFIDGNKIDIQNFCIDSNIEFEVKVKRNSEFIFMQLYKDLGIFKNFNIEYLNETKKRNEKSISKTVY